MRRSHFFAVATLLLIGLCLAGCTSETPTAPAAAPSEAVVAPIADAAALSVEELRARASTNLKANQLHSPAGDNAVEAYLALRDKSPTLQPDVETALVDMEPYVVIAAEQATTAAQFDEAARLIALLGRMDPAAPALGRLTSALADARTAEAERVAEEERARSAQALAEQATREQANTSPPPVATPAQPAAAPPRRAPPPAAPRAATAAPTPAAPAAATNAAPTPSAVAAAPPASRALVSRVAPKYPEAALRRRLEGEVEVMARVAADGSVEQVDVLRSEPPGVFDREAVLAVRRWRYVPAAAASSVRVVLTFKRP
jgi:protein TonB